VCYAPGEFWSSHFHGCYGYDVDQDEGEAVVD
jgi:hypothetical protein